MAQNSKPESKVEIKEATGKEVIDMLKEKGLSDVEIKKAISEQMKLHHQCEVLMTGLDMIGDDDADCVRVGVATVVSIALADAAIDIRNQAFLTETTNLLDELVSRGMTGKYIAATALMVAHLALTKDSALCASISKKEEEKKEAPASYDELFAKVSSLPKEQRAEFISQLLK